MKTVFFGVVEKDGQYYISFAYQEHLDENRIPDFELEEVSVLRNLHLNFLIETQENIYQIITKALTVNFLRIQDSWKISSIEYCYSKKIESLLEDMI